MRLCTLACLVFGATPLAAQNGPSIDCTKANSTAEELICADPALSALDREISRLYDLARGSVAGSDLAMLKAYQRGWIKGRDDCWKARVSITECIPSGPGQTDIDHGHTPIGAVHRIADTTAWSHYHNSPST